MLHLIKVQVVGMLATLFTCLYFRSCPRAAVGAEPGYFFCDRNIPHVLTACQKFRQPIMTKPSTLFPRASASIFAPGNSRREYKNPAWEDDLSTRLGNARDFFVHLLPRDLGFLPIAHHRFSRKSQTEAHVVYRFRDMRAKARKGDLLLLQSAVAGE